MLATSLPAAKPPACIMRGPRGRAELTSKKWLAANLSPGAACGPAEATWGMGASDSSCTDWLGVRPATPRPRLTPERGRPAAPRVCSLLCPHHRQQFPSTSDCCGWLQATRFALPPCRLKFLKKRSHEGGGDNAAGKDEPHKAVSKRRSMQHERRERTSIEQWHEARRSRTSIDTAAAHNVTTTERLSVCKVRRPVGVRRASVPGSYCSGHDGWGQLGQLRAPALTGWHHAAHKPHLHSHQAPGVRLYQPCEARLQPALQEACRHQGCAQSSRGRRARVRPAQPGCTRALHGRQHRHSPHGARMQQRARRR
jgi:hypothetical protein